MAALILVLGARAFSLTITHIFCRHTLLQTNSQRESPSHFMGGSESQLRGGFRNFVRRGHGETTSWHGMPFWRTVTVSFGCHTTHIVNIESTAFEGSDNALC
jgi:hypothetical protein